MRCFELMESGLPSDQFLQAPGPSTGPRRRVRFRPHSPWTRNRAAGQRLSWRGRSFVEAFAEVNRREIVEAAFLDMAPGRGRVELGGWRPGLHQLSRFHFICQASEGAYIQVGDERVQPEVGELWRIDDRFNPVILRGGNSGSVHLLLLLAPQLAPQSATSLSAKHETFDRDRLLGMAGHGLPAV